MSEEMKRRTRIAVLMTCHNRREGTLRCLEALERQEGVCNIDTAVYLVDDASSDGTAEAVRARFREARILRGNGSLFWNGGMRLAWTTATQEDYDYYLWLNDDTELDPDAIARLLLVAAQIRERSGAEGIVVGSTRDPQTGRRTYGGVVRTRGVLSFGFQPVRPARQPVACDTMNGNCVLVPRRIVRDVGLLSEEFTHGIADFDYGLRAGKKGYTSWVAPGYVGTCRRGTGDAWQDPHLRLSQRVRKLRTPKGLPPWEYLLFVKRHGGFLRAGYALLKLQLKLLFPRAYRTLRELKTGDIGVSAPARDR